MWVSKVHWSDYAGAQADLNLSWSHISEGRFVFEEAQLWYDVCCVWPKNRSRKTTVLTTNMREPMQTVYTKIKKHT